MTKFAKFYSQRSRAVHSRKEQFRKFMSYSIFVFPSGSDGKASIYNVRDLDSIPGLGRFPGEGNGNPSSTLALKIPWTEELGAGNHP